MLELCKTRTKKSSPDMFNFYVVLSGDNKVSDSGRITTWRLKFKAPSLKTKSTKTEETFENVGSKGKPFEDIRQKRNGNTILNLSKKTHRKTRTLSASIQPGLRKQ